MGETSSWFLFILAVLPAIVVMYFVWKMDKREKEPFKLLMQLFGLGALSTITAIILELVLGSVLSSATAGWIPELPYSGDEEEGVELMSYGHRVIYQILSNFIGIALVEEAGKFMMLHLKAWKSPEFDFSYDAVVYAVATSLGFATVENILYVFMPGGGLSVALLRAVLSVPGHAIFAVFMGCFYGKAKYAKFTNNKKSLHKNMWLALLVPVLLHGFYDFCLSMGETTFVVVFFAFEIVVMIVAIMLIRRLSNFDQRVAPPRIPPFIGFPGMPGYPAGAYPYAQGGYGMQPPMYGNPAAPVFQPGQFPNAPGYPMPNGGMMPNGMMQQRTAVQQMPFGGMMGNMQRNNMPGTMPGTMPGGYPAGQGMQQNPAFRNPQNPAQPFGAPQQQFPQQFQQQQYPQNGMTVRNTPFFQAPLITPQMRQQPNANAYPNGYARAAENTNAQMPDLLTQQAAPQQPQPQIPQPQAPAPFGNPAAQPVQNPAFGMNMQNQRPNAQNYPNAFGAQDSLNPQTEQPKIPAADPVQTDAFGRTAEQSAVSDLFNTQSSSSSSSLFTASSGYGTAPAEPAAEQPVFPAKPVLPAEPVLPDADALSKAFPLPDNRPPQGF